MKQVTRNINPDSARDLLERVTRACIAFAEEDGPRAQPIELVWRDQRYFIGFPQTSQPLPGPGQEAVLLVDEGVHFFDLRAVYIRGRVEPAQAPASAGAPDGRTWFEVIPSRTVAWDYGTLHEEIDGR